MTDSGDTGYNPYQNMSESSKKAFEADFKAAYKKNVLPKQQQTQQDQSQVAWQHMTPSQQIDVLRQLVVRHETALKEFGPVLALVMECLTKEGLLEKWEDMKNGQAVTNWRLRGKDTTIKVAHKNEEVRQL